MSISSKQGTIALHTLVWLDVLILPYFIFSSESNFAQIGPLQCNYFTLTNLLHIGLFYFNAFYLCVHLLTRKYWWAYLLSVLACVFILYRIKQLILDTWFHELSQDEDAFAFTFFPIILFLIISTLYTLILDKIHHEKEQLATQLKFLRSQINPHFLFNIHNNLVSMARHKSDLLEPALIKLSGLMRYMLYDSNEKKVSLSAELEYLKSYVELQEIRFGQDVSIQIDIQDVDASHTIEPMLLIPFVENAFKHGITLVPDPFINIRVAVKNNVLDFSVKNKFEREMRSKDRNSGIGIVNVKARLNLLYPKRHGLEMLESGQVFSVHLSINLR